MLKKNAVILYLILLSFTVLLGCESESNGVPESLILANKEHALYTSSFESYTHNTYHNIDSNTHTDTVTLEIIGETEFAKVTHSFQYKYQYTESDDLWTFVEMQGHHMSVDINKEAFIRSSPWRGKSDNLYHNYSYMFVIHDIDLVEQTITLQYHYVNFEDSDVEDILLTEPVTLPLKCTEDRYPTFTIDTSRTGYILDKIWFMLYEHGLIPC